MLKFLIPRSVTSRFLTLILLPIITTQAITVIVFFYYHWSRVSEQLNSNISSEIAFVLGLLDNSEPQNRDIILTMSRIELGYNITLTKNKNLTSIQSEQKYNNQKLQYMLSSKVYYPLQYYSNINDSNSLIIEIETPYGLVQFFLRKRYVSSFTVLNYIIWVIVSIILVGFTANIFLSKQLLPIKRLASATNIFSHSYNAVYIRPSGAIEVRKAIESFNRMSKRITTFIENRMMFLSGISHDFRTPLTRLKLSIEMLENHVSEKELNEMRNDISELQKMLEEYLEYAKAEGSENSQIIDLGSLLKDTIFEHNKENPIISYDIKTNPKLWLKQTSIRRIFSNLINNSFKYSDKIHFNLYRHHDVFIIECHDNGCGIDKTEYKNVLRPFYRIENSRNRETGGTGLGLAIVKDIMVAHGGNINLSSSKLLGGLCVILEFPIDLMD